MILHGGDVTDLQKRIVANIRTEVKAFLREGTPMPERDARWEEAKNRILVEERELYEKEIEAKHMADYETMNSSLKKAYESTNSGIAYDEWLTKAKSLYSINGTTVSSIAKGPDNENEWRMESVWAAKKKVLKLIYYKYYDHFKRGHDFAYDPDEKSEEC